MKLHELKIKHEYLEEIVFDNKTFELRKNDRDYQVGDLIHFIDVDFGDKEEGNGLNIYRDDIYKITYVLKDVPQYGLDKDYCILGIKKLEVK